MNTRQMRRRCERCITHESYRDYWPLHHGKLKLLIHWYPHWGAEPLVKELGVPINVIQNKARRLKLKMLRPRERRICYYCRVNFVGKHRKFGLRCVECFKPYWAKNRRARIHQDPLKERLREIAYQLNSRNSRKGLSHKIPVETLLQLWNRQEGRCAYTGRKMLVSDENGGKRGPDTLSVDRINSRRPYLKDNLVLCTWWTNVAKYDLNADDFIDRCREVVRHADSFKQDLK